MGYIPPLGGQRAFNLVESKSADIECAWQRFTGRSKDYVKYRPGYPVSLIACLETHCGLTRHAVTADIGSGTGAMSRMLLENGNRVYAIDPNAEMRQAAERLLSSYPQFVSVHGAAEATTLPSQSVDLITVARALQWFDLEPALVEMRRILRPGGYVAVIWNRRVDPPTPMAKAYNDLMGRYAPRYGRLKSRRRAAIQALERLGFRRERIPMPWSFDFEELTGLILSVSVAPREDHPNFAPMMRALEIAFEENQQNGRVVIDYVTTVFHGRL